MSWYSAHLFIMDQLGIMISYTVYQLAGVPHSLYLFLCSSVTFLQEEVSYCSEIVMRPYFTIKIIHWQENPNFATFGRTLNPMVPDVLKTNKIWGGWVDTTPKRLSWKFQTWPIYSKGRTGEKPRNFQILLKLKVAQSTTLNLSNQVPEKDLRKWGRTSQDSMYKRRDCHTTGPDMRKVQNLPRSSFLLI